VTSTCRAGDRGAPGAQLGERADQLVDAAVAVAQGDQADDRGQVAALGGQGAALTQDPLGGQAGEPQAGDVDHQPGRVEPVARKAEAVGVQQPEPG
jgi:hypothetical protein